MKMLRTAAVATALVVGAGSVAVATGLSAAAQESDPLTRVADSSGGDWGMDQGDWQQCENAEGHAEMRGHMEHTSEMHGEMYGSMGAGSVMGTRIAMAPMG